jgi:xanthine dehydrogenase YagS FAD-binding subunit
VHPFTLSRVSDAREAIATHRRDVDAVFIAGGTDLIGLMKDRTALPAHVIDINGLPGMSDVDARPDGSLRIGALARMSDVAAHPAVRERCPVIAESLLLAASGGWRRTPAVAACRNRSGASRPLARR